MHLDLTLCFQYVFVLVFRPIQKNHIILLQSEFFGILLTHQLWACGIPRELSLISLAILIQTGLVIVWIGNLLQGLAISLEDHLYVGPQRSKIVSQYLLLKLNTLQLDLAVLRFFG